MTIKENFREILTAASCCRFAVNSVETTVVAADRGSACSNGGIIVRLELVIAIAFAVLAPGAVTTARVPGTPGNGQTPLPGAVKAIQPERQTLQLHSEPLHPGLPLTESDKGVFGVSLAAVVDRKGFGRGTLSLDRNAPTFDEFGFRTTNGVLPPVKLDCTLNLVKKRTFRNKYPAGRTGNCTGGGVAPL